MRSNDSQQSTSWNTRLILWVAAGLMASSLWATPAVWADDDHGSDHHRRHGVVLQPNTRIASAAMRHAQTVYDSSTGLMRFALVPEALALKPGEVLASAPSAAAPYGYLRRVTGVGRGNDDVWMTTVPARLNEAIKDAHVTATLILPTDGSRKSTIVPGGLIFPEATGTGGTAPTSTAGLGSSHALDVEYHDNDVDLSLHGHETTWIGVNVGVDIDAACFFDGDPCFTFDSEAGEQADTAVTINGKFHTSFSKTFPLVDETYDPIVFFIGPVPVVLVPSLEIHLDFDGTANGAFAYAGEANAPEYRMSVHWDSANGFSNGFSSKPAFMNPGNIDLAAEVNVHAHLPSKVNVLLYDAAGVFATVNAELGAMLHIPHKPRWSVDGELKGDIGVNVTLPIVGDLGSTDTTLFDETFHLSASVNAPPHISIQTPVNGQQISFVWPDFGNATLFAIAGDDEDGTPCCTVDWFLGDGSLLAHGNDVVAQLPGIGHYDITARATDSDGASTYSAPVGVDTSIPPAGAGIVLPGPACESKIYTNLPTRLLGRDQAALSGISYTCVWFSDNPADQSQFPPAEELAGSFNFARGCEADAAFTTPGIRTITLGVVPNVPGSTASNTTKILRVLDPPPGGIPVLRTPGPAACETVALDSVNGQLQAFVEAPGAFAGTRLGWTWQAGSCASVPMPVHQLPPSVCGPDYCATPYQIRGAELAAATPANCAPPVTGTVNLTATDPSGNNNTTQFTIQLSHQVVR